MASLTPSRLSRAGRDFIARHGETVFNAAGRVQGGEPHTPLTRAGFTQADEIGRALRAELGSRPALTLWASPTGRALQTLAVIAEHLELDWHAARVDPRLVEIDMGGWTGRYYRDLERERGAMFRPDGLIEPAPDGEDYRAIAERLDGWINSSAAAGDRLVVSHGMTSRVLRGMLTGLPDHDWACAPVAPGLPQGSVVMVEGGQETLVHRGSGRAPA